MDIYITKHKQRMCTLFAHICVCYYQLPLKCKVNFKFVIACPHMRGLHIETYGLFFVECIFCVLFMHQLMVCCALFAKWTLSVYGKFRLTWKIQGILKYIPWRHPIKIIIIIHNVCTKCPAFSDFLSHTSH